jgi:hypothetical protein
MRRDAELRIFKRGWGDKATMGLLAVALSCARAPETRPATQPASGRVEAAVEVTPLPLPRSDRKLYVGVNAAAWKNPYLSVEKTGVRVIALGIDATVSVPRVAATLRALPSSAWPYGAVVAVNAGAMWASDGSDEAPIAANWSDLQDLLRRLGIEVEAMESRVIADR